MIKSILRAYSRLIIFAVGLLAGIQVPSFVDQYEKRIDAHFREVSANISGFRLTAEFLFEGDMDALVDYYRRSNDEVFQRDGDSIQLIVERYDRISAEMAALNGGSIPAALHVALASDAEFFDETLAQYSYTVPLNLNAVQWGVVLALVLTVLVDLLLFSCAHCVRALRRRQKLTPINPEMTLTGQTPLDTRAEGSFNKVTLVRPEPEPEAEDALSVQAESKQEQDEIQIFADPQPRDKSA